MYVNYYTKYDEDNVSIKKENRRAKIDKRERQKQDFMKINSRGLITDVLPAILKRAREDKDSVSEK